LGVAAAISLAGIWICGESARRIGVHDHGGIVWDEIAGMYLTLMVAPISVFGWILAFVLFRIMDIVKPWPIRDLDHRLGRGLGIMLDDLAAALYAAILLLLYGWFMT
jgi:phosphatidylglycerophosphatase A